MQKKTEKLEKKAQSGQRKGLIFPGYGPVSDLNYLFDSCDYSPNYSQTERGNGRRWLWKCGSFRSQR